MARTLFEIEFIDGSKMRAITIHAGRETGKIFVETLGSKTYVFHPDEIKKIRVVEVSTRELLYESAKRV